jgi:hypothetical protein
MSSKDYFADGQWNFFCDLCGAKNKSSDGRKTWDNFYVCAHHKEERNPQDFVRGIKDDQSVPWSRPEAPDNFIPQFHNLLFTEELPIAETVTRSVTLGTVSETLTLAESIVLQETEAVQTETLGLTEVFSIKLIPGRVLDGAPLNTFTLN